MTQIRRPAIALLIGLSITGAFAACASLAPARFPPHIKHTPGAFIVVTDRYFDAGSFRLELPSAWILVKASPASADFIHIVFSAPDGGSVALRQTESGGETDAGLLTLPNGIQLQVSIEPAQEPSPAFLAQARRLVASIRS